MMIKISLDKNLKDLAGKNIPDTNLSGFAANSVLDAKTSNPIKNLEMARTLFTSKEITVDSSDYSLIYKAVEADERMKTLAKGQILLELKYCKELSESGKSGKVEPLISKATTK